SFLPYRQGSPIQGFSPGVVAHARKKAGEVVQRNRDVRMLRPQHFLLDLEFATVKRLRLGIVSFQSVDQGEAATRIRDREVLLAERLLFDLERPFSEFFRL